MNYIAVTLCLVSLHAKWNWNWELNFHQEKTRFNSQCIKALTFVGLGQVMVSSLIPNIYGEADSQTRTCDLSLLMEPWKELAIAPRSIH